VQNPTYEYAEDGVYTVCLTVTESDGDTDTMTKVEYITVIRVNAPPEADPNGPYTGTEGVAIAYDGSGSYDPDGSIAAYRWDFGDGDRGTGVAPTHTYAQNGTHSVTLTVTDNDGATNRSTTTATIADTEPTADFSASPTSGQEPLTVTFTDNTTSHDGIVTWDWDFDNDGETDSTVQNPTYEYAEEGVYTVCLTVTESDGDTDTMTKVEYITVIRVNAPPEADPNGPYTGTEGVPIVFTGSCSYDPDGSIVAYEWEFGDGDTATGEAPAHTYAQDGTYTVALTVTDNDGATNMSTTTATIADTEPTADFSASPTSGQESLTVTFTDNTTSHDGLVAWSWDFDNDGVADSTEQNPTYEYAEDGVYTVNLKVRESDGDSETKTQVEYITVINVNAPPVSNPAGPYTGTEAIPMDYDGSNSYDPDGSIVAYEWDFGDGNTATGAATTHTYAQNGTYTVTLTVTDNDGAINTSTTTATIADTEPTADFSASPTSGRVPFTVEFADDSVSYDGIEAWEWDFDNNGGTDSTEQNPTQVYAEEGVYTVSLTVYESDGGSDTKTKVDYITVIEVNEPPVSNPSGPYTGTEGVAIDYDGSGSYDPDGSIVAYDWDFGDGNTATGVTPTHTYSQEGSYTITLKVTDNDGAINTSTTTATIADTEPTADFSASPTSGRRRLTVEFTDNSTSYTGIDAWEWDFDNDGETDSTEQNPTHVYTKRGVYTVSLTVYELYGASDTMTKDDYIEVARANMNKNVNP
jgi:PKD repeat protein